jgi:hypothetical protein
MTKKQCLKPWAVARQLPSLKWVIIGRYRSRSDADGHLQLCIAESATSNLKSCLSRLIAKNRLHLSPP